MEENDEIKGLPGEEQYHQGINYFIDNNREAAEASFIQAAKQGFLAADLWLYSSDPKKNEKRKENAEKAYQWLLKEDAKDEKNKKRPWVQSDLGFCCSVGIGCEKNLLKAIEYSEKAAQENHRPALANLTIYYYFKGGEENVRKAFDYAKRAADLGDVSLQLYVADCFEAGKILGLEEEQEQSRSARAVTAQVMKKTFLIKQDLSQALHYYELAAGQGNADAQFKLGLWYEKGKGVAADEKKANRYFHLAAQGGDERAQKKAAVVEDSRAYDRNVEKVLGYLTLPLNFNRTAENHAIQMERAAETYEALANQIEANQASEALDALLKSLRVEGDEEEKKTEEIAALKDIAKGYRTEAAILKTKAKQLIIGVLTAIEECKLHTLKWRFYEKKNGQEQPRENLTLEANLIVALCYSHGISGFEENKDRATEHYQAALVQAKETGFSSIFFDALAFLAKKTESVEIEAIPKANPYTVIANTLLFELLSDYREIKTTHREDFFFQSSKEALDDKQGELEIVILRLSKRLAEYLEFPNEDNKQAFLSEIDQANNNDFLGNETTVAQTVFNVLISFTGAGLLVVLLHRYISGHWGLWNNDFADKLERLQQTVQAIAPETIRAPVKQVSTSTSEDAAPYLSVPPPTDIPPLPNLDNLPESKPPSRPLPPIPKAKEELPSSPGAISDAEKQSFQSDKELLGEKDTKAKAWIGGNAPPDGPPPSLPPLDNPPPPVKK